MPERKDIIRRESLLLVSGVFGPEDITASLLDEELSPPSQLNDVIEKAWEPRAKKGWKPINLLHVAGVETNDKKIIIKFTHTNGRDFMGASTWRSWKEKGLDLNLQSIPNPLVTSTVVITSDNKMIIQVRGESAQQAGNIDALGGQIDPDEDLNADGKVNIFDSARREVTEETGLANEHITDFKCLGLIYNYSDTSHYAMPFVALTDLTADEVLNLKRSDEEKKQVSIAVADIDQYSSRNSNHIHNIIDAHLPNVDPEARLTIALARRYARGCSAAYKQYGDQSRIIETYKNKRD